MAFTTTSLAHQSPPSTAIPYQSSPAFPVEQLFPLLHSRCSILLLSQAASGMEKMLSHYPGLSAAPSKSMLPCLDLDASKKRKAAVPFLLLPFLSLPRDAHPTPRHSQWLHLGMPPPPHHPQHRHPLPTPRHSWEDTNPMGTPTAPPCQYLVVIVIQVGISALELHHLDLGHPILLPLQHEVGVRILPHLLLVAAPVTPSIPHGAVEAPVLAAGRQEGHP